MEKLLVLSDSLAIPRADTNYEDTWPYMIKSEYKFDVITSMRRGSTSTRLVDDGPNGVDSLEGFKPNIVIVQIGICDCAPRYFSYKFLLILNKFPRSLTKYILWLKKRFSGRKHTYVNIKEYERNFDSYFMRCKTEGCSVICIGILKASSEFIRKSPNIQNNIDSYNNILKELCSKYDNVKYVVPCANEDIETVISDEHHLNAKGHKVLFAQISEALNQLGYK